MNTTNWIQRGFAIDPAKDENLILNTIPYPIFVLSNDDFISHTNLGAEQNGTKIWIMLPMDESGQERTK